MSVVFRETAFTLPVELEVGEAAFAPCPDCGSAVRIEFDVDRDGQLLEIPTKCSCHADCCVVAPEGQRADHCVSCGTPFAQHRRAGRPFTHCHECR